MASFLGHTDEEIEGLLVKIYEGVITAESLPVELYVSITNKLMEGVFQGYGGTFKNFGIETAFYDLLAEFEVNIQVFSAAKTFQQVKTMSSFVFVDGFKVPFQEFKKLAGQEGVYGVHENWLRTEQRTAVNQAFGGNKWVEYEEEAKIFPLLKYQTVGDERVRPQHAVLDDVVKPVNDSFWNTFAPPNGWNCRCTTVQLENDEEPVTRTRTTGKGNKKKFLDPNGNVIDKPAKLFAHNPGKTKQIFKGTGADAHPYFKVEDRFKQKKRRNFDLPLNEKRVTIPPQ